MRTILFPLILLVLFGGVIAWRVGTVRATAAAQQQAMAGRRNRVATVAVEPASTRTLRSTVEEMANVRAPLNVALAPKVSGRIERVAAEEGQSVTAGQVLVRLDPAELRARVEAARAEVSEAEFRLAQARLGTQPERTRIRAEIEQARAAVATARADLKQKQASAASQIATAKNAEEQARAELENARARAKRLEALLERGFVPRQQVEDAQTRVTVADTALRSATEQVRLVQNETQAAIEVAQQRLKETQAELRLALANEAQNPMYAANIAALSAQVRRARGALQDAQAQLSQTTLRSPIAGIVSERRMDPGAMATPGVPILTIVDIRRLWLDVPVQEEQAAQVAPGLPAEAWFDAQPGKVFTGRVIRLNPAANPQSRSVIARVEIANPGGLLKPGMFGRVRLVTNRRPDVLVVPREAVLRDGQETYVFVSDGETASRRRVTLGEEATDVIEVRSGLQPGETVIVQGHQQLRDGAKIRVARSKADARRQTPVRTAGQHAHEQ